MRLRRTEHLVLKAGALVAAIGLAVVFAIAAVNHADDSASASAARGHTQTPTAQAFASPTPPPSPTDTPTRVPTPTPSAVPTRLVIPSIDVDAPVVELGQEEQDGVLVWETADHAVGHYVGTAMPGQKGNIFLAGHIRHPTEGNVFARLPEIPELMDSGVRVTATLYTADGPQDYVAVRAYVVEATRTDVMAPTSDEILTLMTCVPDWVFDHRLIIICRPPLRLVPPAS
jgi:sortase A